MSRSTLARLLEAKPLRPREARTVLDELTNPAAPELERAALLIALTSRPASGVEWASLAGELRRRAVPVGVGSARRAIDLCGSGGAPRPSFNVSTVSAFVVASAGVPVLKHGNRSARGLCGSSDLLEALGLPVTTSRAFGRASYREERLAFLHAPLYHPATAAVAPLRRALGIPTIFNRLGPLSNPARVGAQVVGWGSRAEGPVVREALQRLGVGHGATMTSEDGCDEFSPKRPTHLVVWHHRRHRTVRVIPSDYLDREDRHGPWGPLVPHEAAEETERILAGGGGARRGSVLLTAGAALWVTGRARTFRAGVERARLELDGGGAERRLRRLRHIAERYRGGARR